MLTLRSTLGKRTAQSILLRAELRSMVPTVLWLHLSMVVMEQRLRVEAVRAPDLAAVEQLARSARVEPASSAVEQLQEPVEPVTVETLPDRLLCLLKRTMSREEAVV
jgi:hypothetical protein